MKKQQKTASPKRSQLRLHTSAVKVLTTLDVAVGGAVIKKQTQFMCNGRGDGGGD